MEHPVGIDVASRSNILYELTVRTPARTMLLGMAIGWLSSTALIGASLGGRMQESARIAGPEPEVVMSIEIIEVRGRGFRWRLRTPEGEVMEESPVFVSLYQCLSDARHSAVLNPGKGPYTRRN